MTAAGPGGLIKAQIKSILDALVTAQDLGAVIEADIQESVLSLEMPGYPCAFLGPSRMEANWEYQKTNRRTYTFDLLIVQLQEQLTSMTSLEDVRDAIALAFDNNLTLGGTAPVGVHAAFSERLPISQGGKNYVVFYVTIMATTLANLN